VTRRLHTLVNSVFNCAACIPSLLRAFPGEFHPFVPCRPDLYYPVGLLGKSVAELPFCARLAALFSQKSSGLLAILGASASTIAAVMAATLPAPVVVSQIMGAMPNLAPSSPRQPAS
jgi:hypothetical protein